MSQHEGLTLDELKAAFSFQKNMDTVFMEYKTYCEIMEKKGKCEFFGNRTEEDCLVLQDAKFLICRNWPVMVSGKPGAFTKFLEVVRNRLKYVVHEC